MEMNLAVKPYFFRSAGNFLSLRFCGIGVECKRLRLRKMAPAISGRNGLNRPAIAAKISLSRNNLKLAMEVQSPITKASPPNGAAVYVDVENLGSAANAQTVIDYVIAKWPEKQPPLRLLYLSVDSAQVEVWRLWAESRWPKISIRVRGVQHFSRTESKNAADISITADVVDDFVTGRIAAAAIVSNDSDFGVLFAKLREITLAKGMDSTPFLWITISGGNLSPNVKMFVPDGNRWDLPNIMPNIPSKKSPPPPANPAAANLPKRIADVLIRELPVGTFKVADALKIVKKRWPQHSDAESPGIFGKYLLNEIWPFLKQRGVKMTRTSSPRTYEITEAAKRKMSGQ